MSDPFDTVRAGIESDSGDDTAQDAALAALAEIERELRLRKTVSFANGDDYRKQYDRAEKAEAERDEAQREADIQMGQKLAAQITLKAVCDVLNLPMVSLGNGWTEATPKILARIEEIVDEAERGFLERDKLGNALAQERAKSGGAYDLAAAEQRLGELETALREIADVVHVVKDAPDGQPVILVRRPETALDAAIAIARRVLGGGEP